MDAGSFVIALLTAAGAAAGPAALGALPDTTAPAARCIAPPEERTGSARSRADAFADRRADSDVGLDSRAETGTGSPELTQDQLEEITDIVVGTDSVRGTGQDTNTGSSTFTDAVAQELARTLADIVAESDDPTSQRIAAALAEAGFEPSGSGQETAASRTDDTGLDDTGLGDRSSRADQRDRNRLDDQLGNDQNEPDRQGGNDLDDNQGSSGRQSDDRLGRDQDEDPACDGQAAEQNNGTDNSGADRSSALEDVLSSQADERERAGSERSDSPAGGGGSGIAEALERGERTAG